MTTATATSSTPQNTDAAIPTRRVKRHPRVSGVEMWLAAAAARASAEARVGLLIVGQLVAALADPAGVISHRPGALERVALLFDDWFETHRRLRDTETRMLIVLDELQLTELVTSITGGRSGARNARTPFTPRGSPT